ncbi:conserved hypothetical protein [Ricinus communis]|uniref:Uncharacterized protein n=1 Tax=Ricinus communis TaxID=3988 RepID=B9RAK2_RICCO|nr:conserved hypothetical protein [Ricinus communis]
MEIDGNRNEDIFQPFDGRKGSQTGDILNWSKAIIEVRRGDGIGIALSITRIDRMISWNAPPEQWVKINTDGAFTLNNYVACTMDSKYAVDFIWKKEVEPGLYSSIIYGICRMTSYEW